EAALRFGGGAIALRDLAFELGAGRALGVELGAHLDHLGLLAAELFAARRERGLRRVEHLPRGVDARGEGAVLRVEALMLALELGDASAELLPRELAAFVLVGDAPAPLLELARVLLGGLEVFGEALDARPRERGLALLLVDVRAEDAHGRDGDERGDGEERDGDGEARPATRAAALR